MTDRRRPLRRDPLDVEATLKHAAALAPEIELGWSLLRRAMGDAGWPTRAPAGDRADRGGRGVPEPPADLPMVWRCACGHDFATAELADEHLAQSGHDSHEPVSTGHDTTGVDYNDPTGDMAMRLDALANDLDTMQENWRLVATSLHALARIARRHIPAAGATRTEPACSVTTCDQTVERTPSGNGYRSMEQIAGHWVAKPGCRPTCRRHRNARDIQE